MKRSPIISILAHVDHGKTTLLDRIRNSKVAKKEAGGITQMIAASYVSKDTIEGICGDVRKKLGIRVEIPGLLFIDTPGHEAFQNMRERGGNLADLAVLVIDVMQGVQPQTEESIKILRHFKTPFIVALNKIDLVPGWRSSDVPFSDNEKTQTKFAKDKLEERLYAISGHLSEFGFTSERFDRITDFTKEVAIVPISAQTGEGMAELLILITGLSQKFLSRKLEIDENAPAEGSIIEIKEVKGMGNVADAIIYEGVLTKGSEMLFLSSEGVKKTRIRGLLQERVNPKNPNERYVSLEKVVAAAGVRIVAPNLDNAIPGSPIKQVRNEKRDKLEIEKSVRRILFRGGSEGTIAKAESLGSCEALINLLEKSGIKTKEIGVGQITKRDVLSASVSARENEEFGAILGFNVSPTKEAEEEAKKQGVKIITSNVIYKIIEEYREFKKEIDGKRKEELMKRKKPAKAKFLKGCCFRKSKPAVFGIKVLLGTVKNGMEIMDKNGKPIGKIKGIQKDKEAKGYAEKGEEVAISCEGMCVGKDITEGDIFYSKMDESDIKELEKRKDLLSDDEIEALEEIKQVIKKSVFDII